MQFLSCLDPVDVLLVIGARRDDEARLPPEHAFDGRGGRANHGGVAVGHRRAHLEKVADLVLEAGAQGPDPFEHRGDLALHLGQVFLDQVAAVDDDAAAVRDAGCGQAGIAVLLFPCAAVDRVDVEGRLLRAFRDHRHFRALGGEKGEKRRFHLGEDGAHVAHR